MDRESQPILEEQLAAEKEALYQRQKELVEQIKLARAAKDTTQLRTLFEELKRISLPQPEKGAILPEILQQSQALYDWLGIETNLQKEAQEGKIVLPSAEQQEAAEKEGYSLSLIILGELPREELLAKVKEKYASGFKTEGIYYWEQAQKDLKETEQAKNSSRPKQSYLIYLKPQREVHEAHPETKGQSAIQAQETLENRQKEKPALNLKGLTLEEYLLEQALVYQQTKEHLESQTWTWLLEEKVIEEGKFARCLRAGWYPDPSLVGVFSDGASLSFSNWGARFAALPADLSAEARRAKVEASA